MTKDKIKIYVYEPVVDGGTYLFEVEDQFGFREIHRKVYFDSCDGLYILYKGKRYFEYEFIYP